MIGSSWLAAVDKFRCSKLASLRVSLVPLLHLAAVSSPFPSIRLHFLSFSSALGESGSQNAFGLLVKFGPGPLLVRPFFFGLPPNAYLVGCAKLVIGESFNGHSEHKF